MRCSSLRPTGSAPRVPVSSSDGLSLTVRIARPILRAAMWPIEHHGCPIVPAESPARALMPVPSREGDRHVAQRVLSGAQRRLSRLAWPDRGRGSDFTAHQCLLTTLGSVPSRPRGASPLPLSRGSFAQRLLTRPRRPLYGRACSRFSAQCPMFGAERPLADAESVARDFTGVFTARQRHLHRHESH